MKLDKCVVNTTITFGGYSMPTDEIKGSVIQIAGLLVVLAFYHVLEYVIHRKHHPTTTDKSSFLITPEYLMAFSVGIAEYLIELYFFPWKERLDIVFWFGVACVAVGLYIRFAAILTAGKSFTHLVQYTKRTEHKLITTGIYKYIRHPGYLGFFIFAVGTQIALKNPISICMFIAVLWRFFSDRIADEEEALCNMFPNEYDKYRKTTPTYIPFIK